MEELKHASNVELLSALTGDAAAHELLRRYQRLTDLARASFGELQQVDGVGRSRAAAIKAAFMLAQRLSGEAYPSGVLMDTPERVAEMLREANRLYTVEHLQVILVNTRRRLLSVHNVAQGTLDTVIVAPREVFKLAFQMNAAALILVHNHPSGDPSPSEADIKITRDFIRAGQILKIEVLDHIILGQRTDERPRDFVSLRETGYFTG